MVNGDEENCLEIDSKPRVICAKEERPRLPPKLKKKPLSPQPIHLTSINVSPSSDLLVPPLVPVKTVSKRPTNTQNGGVLATSHPVPTKMIPVNLKPVASIFDTINDDDVISGPKCLKIGNKNILNQLESEKALQDLCNGDSLTNGRHSADDNEESSVGVFETNRKSPVDQIFQNGNDSDFDDDAAQVGNGAEDESRSEKSLNSSADSVGEDPSVGNEDVPKENGLGCESDQVSVNSLENSGDGQVSKTMKFT